MNFSACAEMIPCFRLYLHSNPHSVLMKGLFLSTDEFIVLGMFWTGPRPVPAPIWNHLASFHWCSCICVLFRVSSFLDFN